MMVDVNLQTPSAEPSEATNTIEGLCSVVLERLGQKLSLGSRGVVALAGSVAVGKSTLSESLAQVLRAQGFQTSVVSTDGFLLPNRVLEPLGLAYIKGLPHTYDWHALRRFLAAASDARVSLSVPVYSHTSFNADGTGTVPPGNIVIVEGVNALHGLLDGCADLTIYVDAGTEVIAGWYIQRFVGLIEAAERDCTSFYARFTLFNEAERIEVARSVWDSINLPNLEQHIAPTKITADIVVTLLPDHSVVSVANSSFVWSSWSTCQGQVSG
jgi:type I pantothenate kinase